MTSALDDVVESARAADPERWDVGPVVARDVERFAVITGDESGAHWLGRGEVPPLYLTSVLEWGNGPTDDARPDGLSARAAPHVGHADVRLVHGGQQIRWYRPLALGADRLVAHRHVRRADLRRGRAGRLAVLDLETRFVEAGRGPLARCRETILCLESEASAHVDVRPAAEVDASARFDVEDTYDELRLVRFSAVTTNTHRVHVDTDVARREGFAGPVVQSALHGSLLLRAAMRVRGGRVAPRDFGWRNVSPATAGERLRAAGRAVVDRERTTIELTEWATDGVVTARGVARFGPMAGPGFGAHAFHIRDTADVDAELDWADVGPAVVNHRAAP